MTGNLVYNHCQNDICFLFSKHLKKILWISDEEEDETSSKSSLSLEDEKTVIENGINKLKLNGVSK